MARPLQRPCPQGRRPAPVGPVSGRSASNRVPGFGSPFLRASPGQAGGRSSGLAGSTVAPRKPVETGCAPGARVGGARVPAPRGWPAARYAGKLRERSYADPWPLGRATPAGPKRRGRRCSSPSRTRCVKGKVRASAGTFPFLTSYLGVDSVFIDTEEVEFVIAPGEFHTYRVTSEDMEAYIFSIEGVPIHLGTFEDSLLESFVGFGDGVQGRRSLSRWDYFQFGVVPEPAAPLMAAVGVVSMMRCMRARRVV
jgi:hypothetical protein